MPSSKTVGRAVRTRKPHLRAVRLPVEVRQVAGGRVGLAMQAATSYLLLTREQATSMTLTMLRALGLDKAARAAAAQLEEDGHAG